MPELFINILFFVFGFGFRFANSTLFHNCIFKRLTEKIKIDNSYKMILDILIQYNNIFHNITRLLEEGYLLCICRIMILLNVD